MFSSENKIFEDITTDQAFEKAERLLRAESIEPSQFEYLYGKEAIAVDEKYVEEKEREFKKSANPEHERLAKLATVFEAIVHDQVELNEWFGENVNTIKTSRFDDIRNGVDSVAEFREGVVATSHLAFAIDVTFSGDTEKKFERIREEIERGELARVKYFVSERTGFIGELRTVPRVVVGADVRTVKQLSELWLERDNKSLAKHPIQLQILEEISSQLEAFRNYAEKKGKDKLVLKYNDSIELIQKILEDKKVALDDTGERDSVFSSIQENLSLFN